MFAHCSCTQFLNIQSSRTTISYSNSKNAVSITMDIASLTFVIVHYTKPINFDRLAKKARIFFQLTNLEPIWDVNTTDYEQNTHSTTVYQSSFRSQLKLCMLSKCCNKIYVYNYYEFVLIINMCCFPFQIKNSTILFLILLHKCNGKSE